MCRIKLWSICLSILICGLATAQGSDNLLFIHHSSGGLWLWNGHLAEALNAKSYIGELNELGYTMTLAPDPGRPASLGTIPGDHTDMNHWIRWFNDYYYGLKTFECQSGSNRIIMFKSCFPNSDITAEGTESGDPFSSAFTLTNFKALYRHAEGQGHTYPDGGYTYQPLEVIFAAHPDTLFIPVTAPPLHYAPTDATSDANAHRARLFNNWLKNEWLPAYKTQTGLNNVAIFDWFDILAYPDTAPSHPNRLRQEYGGDSGDSHPNDTGTQYSTTLFATNPNNFIDTTWDTFSNGNPHTDADSDGLSNSFETANGLDPNNADSDNDGLPDGREVGYDGNINNYDPYDPINNPEGTDLNALSPDTDNDGANDNIELTFGHDPLNPTDTPHVPLTAWPTAIVMTLFGIHFTRRNS